jgi:hypothetical protein
MPKPKTAFLALRVPVEVLQRIDNLAGASHLDRSEFVKAWLGCLSHLKREFALRAMADIPAERFRGLPGRPVEAKDGEATD